MEGMAGSAGDVTLVPKLARNGNKIEQDKHSERKRKRDKPRSHYYSGRQLATEGEGGMLLSAR